MTCARKAFYFLPLCGLLAACGHNLPTGQVVATVNGVEITRNELGSEPAVARLAPNTDVEKVLPKVLGDVITRKIAVEQAKALKLDQTPEFIAQQRLQNEELLSQLLFDRWSSEAPAPSPAAIADFIAKNPQMFGGHKTFLLDELQTSATGVDEKALEPLNTIGDIAAYFDHIDHKYRSGQSQLDSGDMAPQLYAELVQKAPGSAIVVKSGEVLNVISVRQVQDAPIPAANQSALATTVLRHRAANERLMAVKKDAKIVYSAGFAPQH